MSLYQRIGCKLAVQGVVDKGLIKHSAGSCVFVICSKPQTWENSSQSGMDITFTIETQSIVEHNSASLADLTRLQYIYEIGFLLQYLLLIGLNLIHHERKLVKRLDTSIYNTIISPPSHQQKRLVWL